MSEDTTKHIVPDTQPSNEGDEAKRFRSTKILNQLRLRVCKVERYVGLFRSELMHFRLHKKSEKRRARSAELRHNLRRE